ncbi:MAG TPA: hypothetical protein VJH90_03165 [archaeon]|nr:hypothetical protein [archaeon]
MSSSTRTRIELIASPMALGPFYEEAESLKGDEDMNSWHTPSEALLMGISTEGVTLYERRKR